MCFSAPVSLITSAALVTAGVASVPLAKTPGRKMIAAVPFLFAAQQLIEGLQWLVARPSAASDALTYAFLVFAFLLWPTFIPIAVLMNERKPSRKVLLRFLSLAGIALSIILLGLMLSYPIHAIVHGASLRYDLNTLGNTLWTSWYIVVVVGSFFVSSDKLIRLFGLLTAISVVISAVFYNWVFTSVWCFFAAVLSILMYLYLRLTKR